MSRKFILVDGHAHCYRSFYAIRHLSAPDGRPTNAAFGFTRLILNLLKKEKPDYLAVAFDTADLTFRHEQYEDYKAQRQPMPDDLSPQMPIIRDILDAANVPVLAVPGYEADDVIGTLAKQASSKGIDVYIATGDKDALQLLDEHIRIYDTQSGKAYSADDLEKDKGIRPEQVPDMMALSGDTSDNVPGIRGVGPKTALKLIQEYGTLDNVLDHADEVSGDVLSKRLAEGADDARASRRLVQLDVDVPLELSVEDCRRREPDKAKLIEIFRDLGFKKFIVELGDTEDLADPPPVTTDRGAVEYHIVQTPEQLDKLVGQLAEQDWFSFDLETTSRRPMKAHIVGLSFAWSEREAWYVPVAGPLGSKTLPVEDVLDALRPLLENERPNKIGQNLKYDAVVLCNNGIRMRGITFDTMVAAYLLDPDRRRYNLDDLTLGYLGYRKTPIAELIGTGKNQITMDRVEVSKAADYACEDADAVVRLYHVLAPQLDESGLARLARDLEFPLVEVLAEMEYTGIPFDASALADISEELSAELEFIAGHIYDEAGETFNINSPQQLSVVLFDKLGLPPKRKTQTGYSTAAGVLEELAIDYPIAAMVSRYRQLQKLKNTYTDVLPRMVNKATGRIHTSFNQTMTATGRLSSSEPNLQNIPVRTEEGRNVRRAFVASSDDRRLLAADYSQIELRIMAHLSDDPALCDAFRSGLDIHSFVAAEINGVGVDDVDRGMRRRAKAVNFGIIYGLTPYGLSRGIGVSVETASDFIDAYFKRYSRVQEFIETTIEFAREHGFVTTMFGRRRYLKNISSENANERRYAERMAVNAVIQGTAADMAKIAMNRIYRRIESENRPVQMLLQIHDELVFEVQLDGMDAEREMIRDEMVGAGKLDVPVKVNIGVGPNWLDAK